MCMHLVVIFKFVDLNLQISKLEDTVPKLSYLRDAKLSAVSNQLHCNKHVSLNYFLGNIVSGK